jgi:hypothetical protein
VVVVGVSADEDIDRTSFGEFYEVGMILVADTSVDGNDMSVAAQDE